VNLSPSAPSPPAIDDTTYRFVFDRNPQAMWLFDEETLDFLDVNQAAVAVYGYSRDEFLAMKITQIRRPEDVPALLETVRGKVRSSSTWVHLTKAGVPIDVEVASARLTIGGRAVRIATVRDVSEKRKLEEDLRQAQRIETVGQLAGGVAHDFNNLLTAIIGHADLLSEYFVPGDPRAVEIAGIRYAADLASSLTRQLLAFSRKQLLHVTALDINDVVDRTKRTLGRLIGEHIELVNDLAPSLYQVKADPSQIEQILLNLAVNSRDAMPHGGRLTLTTRNLVIREADARRLSLSAGDYVVLSVADTGVGIDPAVRMRIFEPFFTTKERGRGTGMGLATVYGIVKQSGGHIAVASGPVSGTTFTIYLPATHEDPAAPVEPESARPAPGSETVLLVEDDAAVRSLISEVLKRRGYHLLVADGGEPALELASAHGGPIDMLITDIIMPGISGIAVADRIRERHNNIAVLFVSGYADEALVPSGFLTTGAAFLRKPFTPDALARKVRAVLQPTA
jgi:PAS domain S-box-containing protein